MDTRTPLLVIFGLAALVVVVLAVVSSRLRSQIVPNYRSMFVLGIAFIPIGVAGDGMAFLAPGLVFMAVGLANRSKWGHHTRWADYPPELRRIKLIGLSTVAVLALTAIAIVVL